MQNNDKNIDQLFQEAAKEYKAKPSTHAWEEIRGGLKKKKNIFRRLSPILKIAAVFILVSFVSVYLYTGQGQKTQIENLNRSENADMLYSQVKSQNLYNIYRKIGQFQKRDIR